MAQETSQSPKTEPPAKSFKELKPLQQATIDAVIYKQLAGCYMTALLSGLNPDLEEMRHSVSVLRQLHTLDMQSPQPATKWQFPQDMLHRLEAARIRAGDHCYDYVDLTSLNALCDRMTAELDDLGPSPG